jgi:uridine kinase
VAVDGPSGAGKTTVAQQLADELDAPIVHMDDIYPGWDGLAEAIPALVSQILAPLAAGRQPSYRRWDWARSEYGESRAVPAAEVLVVEGVGCGSRPAAPYVSVLIWVDAPRDQRRARGIARDGAAYAPHWERWAHQEEALFAAERTAERADFVIDGSGLAGQ